jgi:hypothetical protein
MDVLDLFFHLLSFAAPAIAVGAGVAFAARFVFARQPESRSWWFYAAINSIAGIAVLVAGLAYFGVDGKMATYSALVVAVACAQWLSAKGWKA